MEFLAILVAVGGFLTIVFAFTAMSKAVPGAAKETVEAALGHVKQASTVATATAAQLQAAAKAAVEDPANNDKRAALTVASSTHAQAVQSLTEVTGPLKESLEGVGTVFKDLGTLSPPVAALCVAVLMFLTAGGIELAERLT